MSTGGGWNGGHSADLDLVLVRWLCSEFRVQLGLAELTLLPEFLSVYPGAPAIWKAVPRGCSSHGKWHRCQRKLTCMRSFKVCAPKWHSAISAHMLLAQVSCKAKANVKEQASALCFLYQETLQRCLGKKSGFRVVWRIRNRIAVHQFNLHESLVFSGADTSPSSIVNQDKDLQGACGHSPLKARKIFALRVL